MQPNAAPRASAPRFARLERQSQRLADLVHQQLLDEIAAGRLPPGERLVQGDLADVMDVSRTPVREALLRLERERVLEAAAHGGFTVRRITTDEARQLYQAREAIEGHAARVVADSSPSAEVVAALDALVTSTESVPEGDLHESFRRNDAMHRAIVEHTGNTVMIEAFDLIWARSTSFVMYAVLAAAQSDKIAGHPGSGHREILDAMAAGDGLAAQERMIEHIRHGLDDQIAALTRAE